MDVTHPPGSTAAAGSLRIGLASAERDHGVIARRYRIQLESGLLVGIVEPSTHLQGFLDAERPPELDLGTAAGIAGRAGPLKQHFLGAMLQACEARSLSNWTPNTAARRFTLAVAAQRIF